MKNKKGFFITIEGGDGSGKSTLIAKIEEELLSRHLSVIKTREPGGTALGEEIRPLLLKQDKNQMSSYAELCLFLASRAQHIKEVILPALKEKKMVLCDRFNDSTIAYQGYARELGIEPVKNFCEFVCNKLNPDITLYLDIDPLIGLQRVIKNKKKQYDRIESEHFSFHQKIREGFHLIAKKEPKRFILIDATKSKEEVFALVLKQIDKKLTFLEG